MRFGGGIKNESQLEKLSTQELRNEFDSAKTKMQNARQKLMTSRGVRIQDYAEVTKIDNDPSVSKWNEYANKIAAMISRRSMI